MRTKTRSQLWVCEVTMITVQCLHKQGQKQGINSGFVKPLRNLMFGTGKKKWNQFWYNDLAELDFNLCIF
jgi:hypothetical protein